MARLLTVFPSDFDGLRAETQRFWPAMQATAAVTLIALIDVFLRGHRYLLVHGFSDEVGHLLTGWLFASVIIMCGVRLSLSGILLGSVVIDLDHIPWLVDWITQPDHLSRSVTHSLPTVIIVTMIGLLDRRRWLIWWGIAVGILLHLLRDLATGNVRFWWPMSDDVYTISYYAYAFLLGITGAIVIVASRACPERLPQLSFDDLRTLRARFNPVPESRKDVST